VGTERKRNYVEEIIASTLYGGLIFLSIKLKSSYMKKKKKKKYHIELSFFFS
jgi:hypothetical protein